MGTNLPRGQPTRIAEPGTFRVVETQDAPGERKRIKYLFPDGSSAIRYMEAIRYNEENIRLVGEYLAQHPDERAYR
jgi:hypothetical protein